MNINWTNIANGLTDVAAFVTSPEITALSALGGPSVVGIVKIVQGVAEVSSDLVATAEAAETAIQSGDLDKIKAADALLQAQNVTLAQQIAAS